MHGYYIPGCIGARLLYTWMYWCKVNYIPGCMGARLQYTWVYGCKAALLRMALPCTTSKILESTRLKQMYTKERYVLRGVSVIKDGYKNRQSYL